MNKTLAVILVLASLLVILNSITTRSASSVHADWGEPTFFSISYPEGFPTPYADQMHFHSKTIFVTFVLFSVPIFFAGYLWGKPKKQKNPNQGMEPTR